MTEEQANQMIFHLDQIGQKLDQYGQGQIAFAQNEQEIYSAILGVLIGGFLGLCLFHWINR